MLDTHFDAQRDMTTKFYPITQPAQRCGGFTVTKQDPTPLAVNVTKQPPTTARDERIVPPAEADFIESVLLDTDTRLNLFFSDLDQTLLPLTRTVYKQAVDCGLLHATRDVFGRVVKLEHSRPAGDVPLLNGALDEEISKIIGSFPCGDIYIDSRVDWKILNSDGLNLAERGESVATPRPIRPGSEDVPVNVQSTGQTLSHHW
ncbi:hypothetical protein BD311DRAFT_82848 [Dichomitus squalens]|uniref:Uncharacterized protein n=1 Tax=Dichomitus squalens TaxID=114155 RepID=A0A4Q9MBT0_9APHY|nr:hypothetical protein BD311DRAFT_82848 [Dichomitus squalens]